MNTLPQAVCEVFPVVSPAFSVAPARVLPTDDAGKINLIKRLIMSAVQRGGRPYDDLLSKIKKILFSDQAIPCVVSSHWIQTDEFNVDQLNVIKRLLVALHSETATLQILGIFMILFPETMEEGRLCKA